MTDYGILLILGIAILAGILGASFFQKLKFPHVVGYIIIGIIIGQSGLKIISSNNEEMFLSLNDFSLGVIGFMVGSELHLSSFKKYGKQFLSILLGEGILAFLLVSSSLTFFFYMMTKDLNTSFALAILFGAIASATDPASTISVLWEYRARGVLTTSIITIVALDDALAMTLYGISNAVSQLILNSGQVSILSELTHTVKELGGAVILGITLGYVLNELLRKMSSKKNLVLGIGFLLIIIGLSKKLGLDGILATMSFGGTLINKAPKRSEDLFNIFKTLSTPIYVIFFVLVGAKLDLSKIPLWLWLAVSIYVALRCIGKYYGAYFGAKLSKSEPVVQKHLGLSLFAQGGIAIGLAINASKHITGQINGMPMGEVLIFGITASTLIVQFLGPAMVKVAINKANEAHKNITEDDILDQWKIKHVIEEIKPVYERTTIHDLLARFSNEKYISYPVVNDKNEVKGIISLDNLKEILHNQESWNWLVTADVMENISEAFFLDTPLKEAHKNLRSMNLQQIPVVNTSNENKLVGLISQSRTNYLLKSELIKRRNN
ncbi:MAG: cation:proton antiporter [Lentisphaeraceae bacterium]|nr:cation:proton antiporter [Lentisphaeraceae bacterium]